VINGKSHWDDAADADVSLPDSVAILLPCPGRGAARSHRASSCDAQWYVAEPGPCADVCRGRLRAKPQLCGAADRKRRSSAPRPEHEENCDWN